MKEILVKGNEVLFVLTNTDNTKQVVSGQLSNDAVYNSNSCTYTVPFEWCIDTNQEGKELHHKSYTIPSFIDVLEITH